MICGNQLKKGVSFETAKNTLLGTLDGKIGAFEEKDKDGQIAVLVGYNLFTASGKIYALLQVDSEIALITVNVTQR